MSLLEIYALLRMALDRPMHEWFFLTVPLMLILWTWTYAIWWQIVMWRSGAHARMHIGYGWIFAHVVLLILSLQPPTGILPRYGDEQSLLSMSIFIWMLSSCLMLHYLHLMKPISRMATTPTPAEARGATRD